MPGVGWDQRKIPKYIEFCLNQINYMNIQTVNVQVKTRAKVIN